MSMRQIYRKIAKENGVSVMEVKREMQEAIDFAYKNISKNKNTITYRHQIPHKGDIPTAEELIFFVANRVQKKKAFNLIDNTKK